LGKGWKLFSLALIKIHLPVTYIAIGIYFIMRYVVVGGVIVTDLVRTGLFIIYVLPLIYYVNKKIRIIEKVSQILKQKIWKIEPNDQRESIE
jgi:hypothetical protein